MNDTNKSNVTIEEIQKQNALLQQQVLELTAQLNWYREQYRLSQQKRFGASSEKTHPDQINILNEPEIESTPKAPEPTVEEITYVRRKTKGAREMQLADLPVETVEYRLSDEERVCPECGGELHQMSKEVRQEIRVTRPQVKVVKHERMIYACRNCEKNGVKTPVVTAPMPKPVLPGSLASSSVVAHVINEKYVNGMPLYRQEKQWERMGIKFTRQNMANWLVLTAEKWLSPMYRRMKEHLLKRDIIHADETSLQVLHEPGRPASTKSYMWLYRSGRDRPPIVLYDYQSTRASKHPKKFLEGFKGYAHVDGYEGYNNMPDIELVGCWSHARRYYDEAIKALPKQKREKPTAAEEGLKFCNRLFDIERELRDVSAEERYEGRLKYSKPVLDDLYKWLKWHKPRCLPKSAFGKAVNYNLNQWDKLTRFLKDGRLELDNNRAERSVKPFVMGRKAWLFANSVRGANSSATIYSIVETAKENGLDPFTYLVHILDTLPNMDITDQSGLDKLMPWSSELPDECRVKK